MKNVAIISEHDPFHNGHKYQTDVLREMGAERIVSVLGGTFSQRGNCHITNKYFRAEAAVRTGGCDLVLELPYPYSCSSAEFFARAGVHIAAQFCDSIAFGCEEDSADVLIEIAKLTSSDGFKDKLSNAQKSTPEASLANLTEEIIRTELSDKHANAAVLPNNILAVEYLKAIYNGNYSLEPIFIKRQGADHDSKQACGNICSASMVRENIINGHDWENFCPKETAKVLKAAKAKGRLGASLQNAERAVLYALRSISPDKADTYAECAGGLGRRILKTASDATTLDELYSLLATKRYTNARIRRAVISMLTGAREEDARALPKFTCLLAANKTGLSSIKRSLFPVISTPSDIRGIDDERCVELYLNAERIASLCYEKAIGEYDIFTQKPQIVSK